MRAARAQHRGALYLQRRRRQLPLCRHFPAHKGSNIRRHGIPGVFPCLAHIPGQLAPDFDGQVVFAADVGQLPLDNRVQFLNTQHFLQALQEGNRQFLREGEGCGHLQGPGSLLPLR